MKIEFKSIRPNQESINCELLLTFQINEIEKNVAPVNIQGVLFTEDNFKIGDLTNCTNGNSSSNWLNAAGSSNQKHNYPFEIVLSCTLSEKSINHIEGYRLDKKGRTKDVVFYARLNVSVLEANIELANIHVGDEKGSGPNSVDLYYSYTKDYNAKRTNMWLLSAQNGAHFLNQKQYCYNPIAVTIDLMDWINNYTQYLNIGNFLVYEFLQPDTHIFSTALNARYDKAQQALTDMRKQLNYGEWKQAIICCRPVFELFKNFTEFKSLLIQSGYTESAYIELSNSIKGFFGLLSKFYHALEQNPANVNDDIPAEKEDAYLVYSYSVSLLYLVAQKVKRTK